MSTRSSTGSSAGIAEADGAVVALRAGTAPDHAALDGMFGGFDLGQPSRYRAFLTAHARALPAVEGALDAVDFAELLPDWPARVRSTALAADLAAIGAAVPTPLPFALSSDWLVTRASANSEAFLGQSPDALIGRPISDILGQDAVHAIRNRIALLRGADGTERIFALPIAGTDRHYDIALHISGNGVVIEAEPCQSEGGDGAGTIRSMMTRLDQATTMEGVPARGRAPGARAYRL